MFNKEDQRKPFDSTVCFTFFGDWMQAIESVEREEDRGSVAYQLFKAVACFSLYGEEPDIEGMEELSAEDRRIFAALWPMMQRQAESSKDRRKQGFADEGPTKTQRAIIKAYMEHPKGIEASMREIARMAGCGKTTVEKVKKKYEMEIIKQIQQRERKKAMEQDRERAGEAIHYVYGERHQQMSEAIGSFADLTDENGELPF